MNPNLSDDKLREIREIASGLEDCTQGEIYQELMDMYKQGKINGLESACEKLEIGIDLNND